MLPPDGEDVEDVPGVLDSLRSHGGPQGGDVDPEEGGAAPRSWVDALRGDEGEDAGALDAGAAGAPQPTSLGEEPNRDLSRAVCSGGEGGLRRSGGVLAVWAG